MKKYQKKAKDMMVTGIGLGVGGSLVSGSASGGIAKLGTGVKMAGSIYGAGMVLDSVKGLQKATKMEKRNKWFYRGFKGFKYISTQFSIWENE